jgi:hypothetical protein
MGIVFLLWGVLLIQYQARSYRGGAATIVGAFLLGIGLSELVGELLWKEPLTTRDAWTVLVAEVTFFIAGLALLVQGHRIHRANVQQNEDI